MFPAEITIQDIILAVVASVGGCVVRYAIYLLNEEQIKFKLHYFFIDCAIAAFFGYFAFLFNIDALGMKASQGLLINCIGGYLGSRCLTLLMHYVNKKTGLPMHTSHPHKMNDKGENHDSKGNTE